MGESKAGEVSSVGSTERENEVSEKNREKRLRWPDVNAKKKVKISRKASLPDTLELTEKVIEEERSLIQVRHNYVKEHKQKEAESERKIK